MKKAKDYAREYIEAEEKDTVLTEIWMSMFTESKELMKARHAKSDRAMVSIFRELNNKWNSMVRLVEEDALIDGFVNVLAKQMPTIAAVVKREILLK